MKLPTGAEPLARSPAICSANTSFARIATWHSLPYHCQPPCHQHQRMLHPSCCCLFHTISHHLTLCLPVQNLLYTQLKSMGYNTDSYDHIIMVGAPVNRETEACSAAVATCKSGLRTAVEQSCDSWMSQSSCMHLSECTAPDTV
jgi:hypothetical protein